MLFRTLDIAQTADTTSVDDALFYVVFNLILFGLVYLAGRLYFEVKDYWQGKAQRGRNEKARFDRAMSVERQIGRMEGRLEATAAYLSASERARRFDEEHYEGAWLMNGPGSSARRLASIARYATERGDCDDDSDQREAWMVRDARRVAREELARSESKK